MFRTLFFVFALAVGLSILMKVVVSIARSVQELLGLKGDSPRAQPTQPAGHETAPAGHFVRDPESGTYVDQKTAVSAVIDGTTYYFESRQTRDAYLRRKNT
jgi:YHS domain-containing protein